MAGQLAGIYIASQAGAPMQALARVQANVLQGGLLYTGAAIELVPEVTNPAR